TEPDRRLQALFGTAAFRVCLALQPWCNQGQGDHADTGDPCRQRITRGRLRDDEVAGAEQDSEHGPECRVPSMPVAQVAPAAVEQEGGDQPVGIFDPQHAQASSARRATARRCRRRWYSQMRTDWMANAATAVGS